jgi:hypothetical protein
MAHLIRTTGTPTNNTKFTTSLWLKKGQNDIITHQIWGIGISGSGNQQLAMRFNDDNGGGTIRISGTDGAGSFNLFSKKKFMDNGWYHFVLRVEFGNSNANKIRLYVNGEATEWDTTPARTYATSTFTNAMWTNSGSRNTINAYLDGSQQGDHHYAEVYHCDGEDYASSTFAETDSNGQWVPKSPATVRAAVTFGNNGYYLPFKNVTSAAAILYDYKTAARSSNNDFSLVNTLDGSGTNARVNGGIQNDFCIMNENSKDFGSAWDFDEGGLKITTTDSALQTEVYADKALPKSGKWYFEVKLLALSTTGAGATGNSFGFGTSGAREFVRWQYSHNSNANGNSVSSDSASLQTISSGGGTGYPSANDIYGLAADLDNNTFQVFKNGSAISNVLAYTFDRTPARYVPFHRNDSGVTGRGASTQFNFGQGLFTTSNSNVGYPDGNGQGKFQYAPPTGFLAICDVNIPNPTIVPSQHFNVVQYDGNGANNRAINLGFQPDLIISKRSQTSSSWIWIDSIRGITRPLASDGTSTQGNESAQVKSFTSTGITIGTDNNINGASTDGYILYGWKGGGSAVSNTDGSITSTVSANTTAGFSVVKYTVPASGNYTIGHGLTKKPDWIIIKGDYDGGQSNTYNYDVYTPNNGGIGGAGYRLKLNSADLRETQAPPFRVEPTSTVWSQTQGGWYSGGSNNIAYCWTAIEGFSDFGYYNGASNTHIHINTGFKPALVIIKPHLNGSADTGWRVFDKTRNPDNNQGTDAAMYFNTNAAQATQNGVDYHNNGFTLYGEGDGNMNKAGQIYFYAAFAEIPAEFASGAGGH